MDTCAFVAGPSVNATTIRTCDGDRSTGNRYLRANDSVLSRHAFHIERVPARANARRFSRNSAALSARRFVARFRFRLFRFSRHPSHSHE